PSADVSVTRSGSPAAVSPDSDITYTITVRNNGPDPATSVAWADTLPVPVTFTSLAFPAGWTCTTPSMGGTGNVNCSKPTLTVADGAQVFTLIVHVPADAPPNPSGFITNQVSVTSSTTDPNNENNSASTVTTFNTCIIDPVVVTNADTGTGSLRRAIRDACVGSTITFDMATAHVTTPITMIC